MSEPARINPVPGDPGAGLRARAEALGGALPPLLAQAEQLAANVMLGEHGRRRAGAGDEFWQYRPAGAGDGARMVDWRRSARSDAHFVREREWQAAQTVTLWVDPSRAMDFSGDRARAPKADRAQLLALALAVLLLRGGERVGMAGEDARPRAGRAQIMRIAQALGAMAGGGSAGSAAQGGSGQGGSGVGGGASGGSNASADGDRGTAGNIGTAGGGGSGGAQDYGVPDTTAMVGHGRAVFVSDFLGDVDMVETALAHACERGVKGALLQVLDPVEEAFPFDGRTVFTSMGGTLRHETLRAGDLRTRYRDRLSARKARLADLARASGWHYHCHHTDEPAQSALLWLYAALERGR